MLCQIKINCSFDLIIEFEWILYKLNLILRQFLEQTYLTYLSTNYVLKGTFRLRNGLENNEDTNRIFTFLSYNIDKER